MEEFWKDIKGFEGLYQVSNLGRVKSLERDVICKDGRVLHYAEKILKLIRMPRRYLIVYLYKNGTQKLFQVHRLVAEAFLPNPNNLPQVNHKNEKPWHNYIHINEDGTVDPEKSDLEWCTAKYNINYGTRTHRMAITQLNRKDRSKAVLQFSLSGVFIKEYLSAHEAHRQTGVNRGNITSCCMGVYKTAGGYIWRYKDAS